MHSMPISLKLEDRIWNLTKMSKDSLENEKKNVSHKLLKVSILTTLKIKWCKLYKITFRVTQNLRDNKC